MEGLLRKVSCWWLEKGGIKGVLLSTKGKMVISGHFREQIT